MRMFYWRSVALENWQRGWIIAIGQDENEAREAARQDAVAYLEERYFYLDEEDEEWQSAVAKLTEDLAATPQEGRTLFIQGSE